MEYELGWIYIGIVAVRIAFSLVQANLIIARKNSKIGLPNQHIYSLCKKTATNTKGYVLMDSQGTLGAFNRAQRGLQNFLEMVPFVLPLFLLAAFVFPIPAMCMIGGHAFARWTYALGYTISIKKN